MFVIATIEGFRFAFGSLQFLCSSMCVLDEVGLIHFS